MFIVGLDLSKNSPGLCVCEDFEDFNFIGIVNNPRMSNVNLNYLLSEPKKYEGVSVIDISQPRKTDPVYHVNERNKLMEYHKIAASVVSEIRKRTGGSSMIIAMEGISYGSPGSSLLDLCMLTGIVRHAMLTQLLENNVNRMFVFSPSELKNAIGLKGGASKTEVLAQFLDDPGIESARNSGMHKFMAEMIVDATTGPTRGTYVYNEKTDEICSPFNDMIDAYLSVLKLHEGRD